MAEEHVGNRRILLMEDDGVQAFLLSEFLQSKGHEVSVAEDAKAAIDQCSPPHEFDLIITDLLGRDEQLPGEGYELIAHVRSQDREAGSATPIVSISGLNFDRERARTVGNTIHETSDVHLTKPVSAHELLRTVEQLLRNT